MVKISGSKRMHFHWCSTHWKRKRSGSVIFNKYCFSNSTDSENSQRLKLYKVCRMAENIHQLLTAWIWAIRFPIMESNEKYFVILYNAYTKDKHLEYQEQVNVYEFKCIFSSLISMHHFCCVPLNQSPCC